MFTIYMFLNSVSGKVYIGQSKKWKMRINTHLYKLRKGVHWNKHLQSSWDLSGEENFSWFSVDTADTLEDSYALEKLYISWYKPLGLVYNHTDGGEGCTGFKQSPEAIERSASKQRGRRWTEEQKEKLKGPRPSLQGRVFKPETLARMSAAKKGKKRPDLAANALNMNAKRVFTPEYRAKLSEANKGNQNFLGKTHSAETIAKMKQRIFTEEHRQSIAEGQKARHARNKAQT